MPDPSPGRGGATPAGRGHGAGRAGARWPTEPPPSGSPPPPGCGHLLLFQIITTPTMGPTCFSSVVLYREWMWPLRVSRVSLARLHTSLLSGIVSTVSTGQLYQLYQLCVFPHQLQAVECWCRKCTAASPAQCSLLLHHLTSRSPAQAPPGESLQTANQDQHYLIWYSGS